MEDRIQINGVWYVKADSYVDKPIPTISVSLFDEDGIIYNQNCMFETEDFIFRAVVLIDGDGELKYKNSLYIEFIDKRPEPWKEEHWDNPTWLNGVILNNTDSIKVLEELKMSPSAIATFRDFLIYLRDEKEWL
jgi:hypothetical protein